MTKAQMYTALEAQFDWIALEADWILVEQWGAETGPPWNTYRVFAMRFDGDAARRYAIEVNVYNEDGGGEAAYTRDRVMDIAFRQEVSSALHPFSPYLLNVYYPTALVRIQHAVETEGFDDSVGAIVSNVLTITEPSHSVSTGDAVTIRAIDSTEDLRGNYIAAMIDNQNFSVDVSAANATGLVVAYSAGASFTSKVVLAIKNQISGAIEWADSTFME